LGTIDQVARRTEAAKTAARHFAKPFVPLELLLSIRLRKNLAIILEKKRHRVIRWKNLIAICVSLMPTCSMDKNDEGHLIASIRFSSFFAKMLITLRKLYAKKVSDCSAVVIN